VSADLSHLADLVEAFPRQSVLVVGDLVADEFVFGDISRVSREAPVLILRHRQTELLPGGAANAANNLADLGARVLPVGVVGDDPAGEALLAYFQRKKVDTAGILRVRGWTTTTKSRFLAGWTHTTRQQVLRVDREPAGPLPDRVRAALARKAQQRAQRAGAVLISDYGCGGVTPALVRGLGATRVTLDARYTMLAYRGCGITAATPNEPELEALYHTTIGTDTAKLEQLAARTLRKMRLEALVVTRGKDGMAVFERGRKPHYIPIYGTDQVADVTGAGDTVIAVFTLALAAGANYVEAAHLANYAGGIVVMKRGTATLTRKELEAAIRRDATSLPSGGQPNQSEG
jgi:rfaE bifunctional protein kinase chain/domain